MARWWQVDTSDGVEPDYRFTLANERTFLAWIRTALGLLAGGVAVRQLVQPFDDHRRPDVAGAPGHRRQRRARRRRLPALGRRAAGRAAGRAAAAAPLVPFVAAGLLLVACVAFVLVALE